MGKNDLEAQLPMLRRIANRYARMNRWALNAEELLHEAALDILEHLDRFDADRGSFSAFCRVWGLHGIRGAVARRCRYSARIAFGDPDAVPTAEVEIEEALDLAHALEQLPERSRRVIVLRFAYGMKQREIATVMTDRQQDVSRAVSSIRTQVVRSIKGVAP